jgi:hypothetical protein
MVNDRQVIGDRDLQLHVADLERGADTLDGAVGGLGEAAGPEDILGAAALDGGVVEDVVDEPGQPLRLPQDDLVVLIQLLWGFSQSKHQRLCLEPDLRDG